MGAGWEYWGWGVSASSFLILPSASKVNTYREAPQRSGNAEQQAAGPVRAGRPAPLSPKAFRSGGNTGAGSSRPESYADLRLPYFTPRCSGLRSEVYFLIHQDTGQISRQQRQEERGGVGAETTLLRWAVSGVCPLSG